MKHSYMKAIAEDEYRRGIDNKTVIGMLREILYPDMNMRYLRCFRRAQFQSGFWGFLSRQRLKRLSAKTGIQIPAGTKIGRGLYLGHRGSFVVNRNAVIGDNCNLSVGCVIGQSNRGRYTGAPMLGNNVWVGTNAVIVGGIIIGDDVLIAPNSYVNRDVPSHSIVVGNPAVVHSSRNATLHYVERCV